MDVNIKSIITKIDHLILEKKMTLMRGQKDLADDPIPVRKDLLSIGAMLVEDTLESLQAIRADLLVLKEEHNVEDLQHQ